jgi:hypothetical protein
MPAMDKVKDLYYLGEGMSDFSYLLQVDSPACEAM